MKTISANNPEERTEYSITQTFCYDKEDYSEDVDIYIPFELLVDVLEEFVKNNYEVEITGKRTAIWNLFGDTGFIDNLFEDDDFVNDLTEAYKYSNYPEMDYTNWVNYCETAKPWED